jgi:hypothetical protein
VRLYDLFRQELERQRKEEIKRVFIRQMKSTEFTKPPECLTKNVK